ncbi:MAG: cell division FtsA domain-containing protein [Planctomycetaceae bacterium]|nr:cell division FtsA domain-containing protein [Planctomycetaceae bacterium]
MTATPPRPPLTFIHLNEHKTLPIRDYTERQKYLEFHNRFATACGLALQGLGQVPFAVDLLPPQKQPSFFGRFRSSLRKKPVPAAWGFDFGYSCFKAVRVTFDEEGVLAVDECFQCYHPHDGIPNDDCENSLETLSEEQIVKLLEKQDGPRNPFEHTDSVSAPLTQERFQSLAIESFLAKYTYQGELICIGYPGHDILCSNFTLPQMPPQQTWQAIQFEVKHRQLADNPNLYQMSYLVLGWEEEVEDEQNIMKQYIHLFLSRVGTIDSKLRLLQNFGIAPNLMTSNILANLNYAHMLLTSPPVPPQMTQDENQNPPEQDSDFEPPEIQSILVCDMGTRGTDLTFYNLREIRHFYLPIGGQDFTKSIAKALGEPFHIAEAIKRNPTKRTEDKAKVVEALKPIAGRLVDEILLRLQHLRKSGAMLDKVVVLGGGFQLNGFAAYFKNLLNTSWKNGL